MKPFCFIHAADLHLDTPFVGIGRIVPALQQRLRDASLSAFDNLVRAAIARKVEFVILAGDIYDGAERGTRAQVRFLDGLRKLDRNDIPCFFIHGNHDPVEEGWSALRREDFPARAVLFDQSDAVRSLPVRRNGEVLALVHGISFRTREEPRNLSRLFPSDKSDAPFHVGLLHCNVGGQPGHDNYAPCMVEDLCARAIDYWALGHIHKRQELCRDAPMIHYPGNLQARGFDEGGPKGATLVRVLAPGQVELEFLPLDEVRFAHLTVETAGCGSLDSVLQACEERVTAAIAQNEGRFLLVRLRLQGQTAAHAALLRAAAVDEGLLASMRDRLFAERVWVDSASVHTLPMVDREQMAQAGGFEAALVGQSNQWLGSDERLVELLTAVQRPLRTGTRFQNLVQNPSAANARGLLQQAEAYVLGLLHAEEEP